MARYATILAALVALPLLAPSNALAYDAENTHRWITRQAVQYLVATYPGEYDELLVYVEEVVEGSYHEDDYFLDGDNDPKTLRVMRHFFHAPDALGLTYAGQAFPNAYQWNGTDTEENEWDYFDAMRAYQRGDLGEAYFIAGHTIHLISDLTVPAHSHLDDHGPPLGDDYEDHCTERMQSPFEGSLRTPAPGLPLPEFTSLQDAFQRTANASYYRNLYPGNLNGDVPSGVVAQMFPDMSKGIISGEWEIDGIGKLGRDFYEDQPGYYYFSKNNAPSLYDVDAYDASNPLNRDYGPENSNAPMVERMADDLVPVAILHSAATLKLFIDQARSLPKIEEEPEESPGGGGCTAAAGGTSSAAGALFLSLLLLLVVFRKPRLGDS